MCVALSGCSKDVIITVGGPYWETFLHLRQFTEVKGGTFGKPPGDAYDIGDKQKQKGTILAGKVPIPVYDTWHPYTVKRWVDLPILVKYGAGHAIEFPDTNHLTFGTQDRIGNVILKRKNTRHYLLYKRQKLEVSEEQWEHSRCTNQFQARQDFTGYVSAVGQSVEKTTARQDLSNDSSQK